MNYGYTMVDKTTAIAPIVLPDGFEVVGLDGDALMVERDGVERRITIPFYDGGTCRPVLHKLQPAGFDVPEHIYLLYPDAQGTHVMHVSVDFDKGQCFVIAKLEQPHDPYVGH